MALTNCKECGNPTSDKAAECPRCGCPIDVVVATQLQPPGTPRAANETATNEIALLEFRSKSPGALQTRTIQSAGRLRAISITNYGLILLLFLLPFINMSCANQRFATLSGVNLAVGTTITSPINGNSKEVSAVPSASIAGFIAIVGLISGVLLKGKEIAVANIFTGSIGAISLITLKSIMESETAEQSHGMLQLDFTFAYWMALVLFIAMAAVSGLMILPNSSAISDN